MKTLVIAYVNIAGKNTVEANSHLDFVKERLQKEMGENYKITAIPTMGEDRVEMTSKFVFAKDDEKIFEEMHEKMNESFDEIAETFKKFGKKMENAFEAFRKG